MLTDALGKYTELYRYIAKSVQKTVQKILKQNNSHNGLSANFVHVTFSWAIQKIETRKPVGLVNPCHKYLLVIIYKVSFRFGFGIIIFFSSCSFE